jgi:hypothetical protein
VTITNTQNRPYDAATKLMVRATIVASDGGKVSEWEFDWNDRVSVRVFAADSDRAIRRGYSTRLIPLTKENA